MEIKDSGERREFESGAVRDIAEGKGRCDLLPLQEVAMLFENMVVPDTQKFKAKSVSLILRQLNKVIRRDDDDFIEPILSAIKIFMHTQYGSESIAIIELSKHYEEGAKKYKERNWEKGIPAHCYIDSCIRHLMKWYDGWSDEPHDRAVMWNLFGLMWTLINKPECDDRPERRNDT